jgi:hypothetical protein
MMNDWENAQIDEMVAAQEAGNWPADDGGWEWEDAPGLDCPYCGHDLDEVGAWLICGNCQVKFAGREDVQNERATLAAEGWAR